MESFPGFTVKCDTCGDTAVYSLDTDVDIVTNEFLARFSMTCQRCGRTESIGTAIPKQDIAHQLKADAEVSAAIADILRRDAEAIGESVGG